MKIVHITCIKKWKGTLPRKNSEKIIRLPILISATLKINVKFQIREKVDQKCQNLSVFYDHTWVPGPIFKSCTSFFGVEGGLRGQKLLWSHVFSISEHRNTWKRCPKMPTVFLACFMTVHGCEVQFSSRMLRFSGRRGLEGSKTAVITRFVLSLSTRIHVIVMERW